MRKAAVFITWVILSGMSFCSTAFAAKVIRVKNNKVKVSTPSGDFKVNEILEVYDPAGNLTGVLRVYRVFKKGVYAVIVKGAVKPGFDAERVATVIPAAAPKPTAQPAAPVPPPAEPEPVAPNKVARVFHISGGVLLGTGFSTPPIAVSAGYTSYVGENWLYRLGAGYWFGTQKDEELSVYLAELGVGGRAGSFEYGALTGVGDVAYKYMKAGKATEDAKVHAFLGPYLNWSFDVGETCQLGLEGKALYMFGLDEPSSAIGQVAIFLRW